MATRKAAVYFILCTGSHLIKIGRSSFPPERHKTLEAGNPSTLLVLGLERNQINTERNLHHRFSEARVRGEWFHPVPELLAHIAEKTSLPMRYYAESADLPRLIEKYPRFFAVLADDEKDTFGYTFRRPHTSTPPMPKARERLQKWEKVVPISQPLPRQSPVAVVEREQAVSRLGVWEQAHPDTLLIPHAQAAAILGVNLSQVAEMSQRGALKTVHISKCKQMLRVGDLRTILSA